MDAILEVETWRMLLVVVPAAAVLMTAAVTDALETRIPNWLTYPALPVGLLVHGIAFGLGAAGWAAPAALTTLVVGILLMLPGWLGGGDAKLLTALAGFVGFAALGEILFYAIWVGFALGIVLALANGYLVEMARQLGRFFTGLFYAVTQMETDMLRDLETDERSEVPFGVAIFVGFVVAFSDARYGWPGLFDWFFGGIG